jgi:hypothetical protein
MRPHPLGVVFSALLIPCGYWRRCCCLAQFHGPFHLPDSLHSSGHYPPSFRSGGLSACAMAAACLRYYGVSDCCRALPARQLSLLPPANGTMPFRPQSPHAPLTPPVNAGCGCVRPVPEAPLDFAGSQEARQSIKPNRVHLRCGPAGSPQAALHPASRRRSCLRLHSLCALFCG